MAYVYDTDPTSRLVALPTSVCTNMTYDYVRPRPDAVVARPVEEPPPALSTPVEEAPPPRARPVEIKSRSRKPPPPHAQSFLICREIRERKRTENVGLLDPFGGIRLTIFPSLFEMSIYAQLTGGHGVYEMALELRDDEDEIPWAYQWADPIVHSNPLEPHRVILRNAAILFPRPGRYALVLLANGDEVARHVLEVREMLPDESERV